jgi:hypothetical protein
MPLVVDASVALAWALPDESSAYADAVLAGCGKRESVMLSAAKHLLYLIENK